MKKAFVGVLLVAGLVAGCQRADPASDTQEAVSEVRAISAWIDRTAELDALADSATVFAGRLAPYVESYAETPPQPDTLARAYRSIEACHAGLTVGRRRYDELASADHPIVRSSLEQAARAGILRCALSSAELRDLGY